MELSAVNEKYDEMLGVLARAIGVPEKEIKAAVIRSYTLNNKANHRLVHEVLRKVAGGEAVTVAGLGGSITQGVAAKSYANGRGNNAWEFTEELGGEKCWFERTVDWLRESFPAAQITGINAGIGATPSFLGTFRLDRMVLDHKPDLVFVEFSVNDPSTFPNLLENEIYEAYESVVRRCLEAGVAVIQVFLNDRDNNGLQRIHSKIAQYYRVPTISYHNAVYPDGKLICDWTRLSPDEIHPNNVGHALLGTCVCNYLNQISLDESEETFVLPENWLYADTFHRVKAIYADQFRESAEGDIRFCTDTPDCSRWFGTLVSSGKGSVRVEIPKGAKRIWVQYHHNNGSFETELNGQQTVCNTSPIGWPRVMWHRVYTGEALTQDTVLSVRSHRSGEVVILGVLIAF